MDVSSTTQTPVTASTSATKNVENDTVISSDFETFLKMLTTQLENQDPLDPVKSEDFAVQLATFSGVEQQVLTNDLLEALTGQLGLSGMSQYANWVGMEARAPVAANFKGTPVTMAVTPQASADNAVLVVQDDSGAVVQRVPVSTTASTYEWDGNLESSTAANGLYSFFVESYSNGTLSSTDPVEVYTKVTEARIQDGEAVLITEGGAVVKPTEITALREGGA